VSREAARFEPLAKWSRGEEVLALGVVRFVLAQLRSLRDRGRPLRMRAPKILRATQRPAIDDPENEDLSPSLRQQ
jgi:hypothetical protein